MILIWCGNCNKLFGVPLKKGTVECIRCGSGLDVDPEWPIRNIVFLLALTLCAIGAYDVLVNASWSFNNSLTLFAFLVFPVAAYFLSVLLFGVRTSAAPQSPNVFTEVQSPQDVPLDGDLSYCPNCEHQVIETASACPKCNADFTATNGWRPTRLKPLAPSLPLPQPTKSDHILLAIILITFGIWVPVYLMLVRPIFNGYIFKYVSGYPAMLHLIPIFLLPIAIGWIAKTCLFATKVK